jgi:hypothetical protein
VTTFSQLPLWKRAFFTNAIAAIGVCIAFASSSAVLQTIFKVRIAVFTFAIMNLMLLVVGPRINAQKIADGTAANPRRVLYEALTERPFITTLVALELSGASRAMSTAIVFVRTSTSDYVRGMPNAHSLIFRLVGAAVPLGIIAALGLLGAIGLWRRCRWAWWLVLVLNGLAALVSGVLQLFKLNEFLLDPVAATAVVLLMLPTVRTEFRVVQKNRKPIPA